MTQQPTWLHTNARLAGVVLLTLLMLAGCAMSPRLAETTTQAIPRSD
ncbi:hypothetical protein [Halomonas sp. E19]